MLACAEPRNNSRGTWITNDMVEAYTHLHELKHAHSLEVSNESGELIGGVYGISIGTIFFGESMFSRETDASKVALLYLSAYLDSWGYNIIDTQLPSAHLTSLGGSEMDRDKYLSLLSKFTTQSSNCTAWQAQPEIDIHSWLNQL